MFQRVRSNVSLWSIWCLAAMCANTGIASSGKPNSSDGLPYDDTDFPYDEMGFPDHHLRFSNGDLSLINPYGTNQTHQLIRGSESRMFASTRFDVTGSFARR